MNERYTPETKPGLWFDGPNYTADAVIIDPDTEKIVLIKRRDTGDWALPGGFIEPSERSDQAAVREAFEETGLALSEPTQCIYRGIVADPRNTDQAWIETSAYLFTQSSDMTVCGSDDACEARWLPLGDLPQLYASHDDIVMVARVVIDRLRD